MKALLVIATTDSDSFSHWYWIVPLIIFFIVIFCIYWFTFGERARRREMRDDELLEDCKYELEQKKD